MSTLAERAAAAAGRAEPTTAPVADEPQTAEPATYTPAPLADPGIPEPGPDGPERVPVHVAWSRVMGEVRGIGKNDEFKGPGGGYHFRGIDSALNAFGPACRLHGVLVLPVQVQPSYRDVKTSTGKNSRECTVLVTYRIVGPAGDHIEVQSAGESMDSGDKGTAKAIATALRSLLLYGGLVPTGDPDPDASGVERGEAPVRKAVEYVDEIADPRTSAGRLRQIHYELRQTGQLGAIVTNEVGDEEPVGEMVVRLGKERAAGGAQ